ncbi:hypothetical protein [Methylobacterium brachythecii]|uniref:Uncharacterized protein n=1 Tax=Methylobacterium brachythecii TaxID=1176177 RepID=A0A7W6AK83_9HYPH|nr:hypothetical protein [Methylobacterium brachythecii]MBB3904183.1 hypothetical protein [Methylobacterium brachythecii]GLS45155.1 hypothetical protein GCM10007884_31440 [Methylobacterium brachythecii]
MASKREQVIQALAALIKGALPQAAHYRNEVKQQTLPDGGFVNIDDGDPGDPEVTLSPATYVFDHQIPVDVAANKTKTIAAETALDTMLGKIGAAIAADRTLGGLCDYVQVGDVSTEPLTTSGAAVSRAALVTIVATYGTTDPLN